MTDAADPHDDWPHRQRVPPRTRWRWGLGLGAGAVLLLAVVIGFPAPIEGLYRDDFDPGTSHIMLLEGGMYARQTDGSILHVARFEQQGEQTVFVLFERPQEPRRVRLRGTWWGLIIYQEAEPVGPVWVWREFDRKRIREVREQVLALRGTP